MPGNMDLQAMQSKKTLVLAPHTDDAELGCGGTMARLLDAGTEVHVVAFSAAEESLPPGAALDLLREEFASAMRSFGLPGEQVRVGRYPVRRLSEHRQDLLEELVALRREIDPDLVLLPSSHDIHQDHQVVQMEGLRAFKNVSVLGYELPWNTITFPAEAFFTLEERHLQAKIRSLHCYASQVQLQRPYFDEEFLKGWARLRGLQVKAPYAEVFEVMRIRW
jgi:N-acetylglucosamine malate deacetylase 1